MDMKWIMEQSKKAFNNGPTGKKVTGAITTFLGLGIAFAGTIIFSKGSEDDRIEREQTRLKAENDLNEMKHQEALREKERKKELEDDKKEKAES